MRLAAVAEASGLGGPPSDLLHQVCSGNISLEKNVQGHSQRRVIQQHRCRMFAVISSADDWERFLFAPLYCKLECFHRLAAHATSAQVQLFLILIVTLRTGPSNSMD